MANSYQDHNPTVSSVGPFSFAEIDGYLDISHIKVYVGNVLQSTTDYTTDAVNKTVTFVSAVAANSYVRIKRETPNTVSGREVTFSSGAIVRPDDLNNAHLQNTFIAQETSDLSIKDLGPSQKQNGQVLTWDSNTTSWIAAAASVGSATLSDGDYGDIVVSSLGSALTVDNGAVSSVKMGGDVTTAGKALLTAANAAAQKTALSISASDVSGLSTVATSGSYTDLSNKVSAASVSTAGTMSASDFTKLAGIAAGAEVNVNADWTSGSGDSQILNKPTLGTSSALNVATTGDAAAGEVVKGNDSRLSDARTPVTHAHDGSDITAGTVSTSRLDVGTSSTQVAAGNHTHALSDLSNVSTTSPLSGEVLKWSGSEWAPAADNTSSGGGAPTSSEYLVLTADASLTAERVFTAGNGVSTTDAGAGQAFTVALDYATSGTSSSTQPVRADDSRLSDARTPLDNSVTSAKIANGAVTLAKIDQGGATDGQVIKWNNTNGAWEPGTDNTAGSGTTVSTDVLWDAKGDLAVATANDAASRLAVGTNGQLLTADSTTATGLAWTSTLPTHASTHGFGSSDAISIDGSQVTTGKIGIGILPTGTGSTQVAVGDHTHTLADVTDSGTAASRNVPATGNAGLTEVVLGADTRLSDARTPTAHTHTIADVSGLQTALDGKAASSHTHTITGNYSGMIETVADGDYYLDAHAPVARTNTAIYAQLVSGTCSIQLKVNGTLQGTTLSCSAAKAGQTSLSQSITAGSEVILSVTSSASTPTKLRWSVVYTQST